MLVTLVELVFPFPSVMQDSARIHTCWPSGSSAVCGFEALTVRKTKSSLKYSSNSGT